MSQKNKFLLSFSFIFLFILLISIIKFIEMDQKFVLGETSDEEYKIVELNTIEEEATSAVEIFELSAVKEKTTTEEVTETEVVETITTEKETTTEEETEVEVLETTTTEKETTTEEETEAEVLETTTTEKEITIEEVTKTEVIDITVMETTIEEVTETEVVKTTTTEKEITTEEETEAEVVESTTTEITTEEETEAEVLETTITEKETEKEEFEEEVFLDLDGIKSSLNKKMQEKGFTANHKEKITQIFDRVSENYDSYYALYSFSGIPAKEKYLMEHLVKPLDNISNINLLDYNSYEAKKMLEEGFSIGWLDPSNYSITYMYKNNDEDAELLFHELSHAQNKAQIDSPDFYFYKYEIFIEGHATYHQQYTNKCISELNGAEIIANCEGNTINYFKNNGLGYTQNYNVYSNLLLVAGHDTMEKVTKEADISYLTDSLKEKYGADVTSRIMCSMEKLTIDEANVQVRYDNCINFENAIIDALCIRLDSLNTKDDIEKFLEFYKTYQNTLLPRVFETDDPYNSSELTYQVFNLYKLENKIVNKAIEYNVLKENYIGEEKEGILSAILFSTFKKYEIYENCPVISLPTCYKGVVVKEVLILDSAKYIVLNYTDILYNGVNIDIKYQLDDNNKVVNIVDLNLIYY